MDRIADDSVIRFSVLSCASEKSSPSVRDASQSSAATTASESSRASPVRAGQAIRSHGDVIATGRLSRSHLPPHLLPGHACDACSTVYILAMLAYPSLSPWRSKLPASQLSGESGSGSPNKEATARHALNKSHVGVQLCFKKSTQISPVLKWTLGWNTRVRKVMLGGAIGYSFGHTILSSNTPPSKGVSRGPRIQACQLYRSCSSATRNTSESAFRCAADSSRINRRAMGYSVVSLATTASSSPAPPPPVAAVGEQQTHKRGSSQNLASSTRGSTQRNMVGATHRKKRSGW
eukprot:CAMPEP_0196777996 /NCGR_PEP_ID=MMETSP1104-20130614/5541_2 /TAXON_ID=33652 /ORGANISM="Cafeteria sp., Strain Caron Lab Isolate" /LENGTH=290 /DNA_ID=CAMNT_0042148163 /DNA_START=851 /DNA_END=1723 /DNA_ORIENTATION=-